MTRAFEKEYDAEAYLFDVVGPRFQKRGQLSAYDFFLIVRWKANRAISKVAGRLLRESGPDLERAVSRLTRQIFTAKDAQERFGVLVRGWRFRLPMASAILTVLYPDDFTVYDVRACDQVKGFHALPARQNPDALWQGYLEFKAAVERATPAGLSLRDKDRTACPLTSWTCMAVLRRISTSGECSERLAPASTAKTCGIASTEASVHSLCQQRRLETSANLKGCASIWGPSRERTERGTHTHPLGEIFSKALNLTREPPERAMAHDDVRSQIDAVLAAYRRRVSEDWERVYADVEDLLAPSLELDAWERALYYHLLRHTRLERREAAGFAIEPLSEAVGISDTKAREVLRSLHRKGCVRIEERSRTGHLVAVLLPADIPGLVRRSDDVVQVDVAALDFTDRRYVPALVAREGGACFYCLKRLTDKTCELDHLAPQVDGLDNSYRNIVAACFNCNKTKGGMLAADLVRQLYREGVLNEKELQLRLAAIVAVQSGQLVPDVGRAAAPKATKRVDPVGRFRGQAIFIESRFAAERRCWRTQHGSMSHADLRWRPLHPDWDHD